MMKNTIGFAIMFNLMVAGSASALSVTPSTDATTLANTILGSGITVAPGSVSYIGGPTQGGTFTGGGGSIGLDSGIILTSGTASFAEGPNTADNSSGFPGTGGNAALNALIPQSTNDQNVLSFDFESAGGDLFFNYVFASEEYNEFTNTTFNDVFAFFLDGENIALIPGTNTPVSINNVNGGNPLGTNASFPQFYNNNDINDGGPFFDVGYDGFTDVFTAQKLGLAAGLHTITLAIADAGDSAWDSAVFIQANSFSDMPPDTDPGPGPGPTDPVPEPSTMLLFGVGIAGLVGFRMRRKP